MSSPTAFEVGLISLIMAKKRKNDHCVFKDQKLVCLHCQREHSFVLPMDLKMFTDMIDSFVKIHKDCTE